jgi:hypothetical protein
MNGKALAVLGLVSSLTIVAACSGTTPSAFKGEQDPENQPGDVSGNAETRDGVATPTSNGLPCDVDAALKTKCQTCHGSEPQFGAPNALVTFDDLQKPGNGGKKVYERIKARIHDEKSPMPPAQNAHLTDKEIAALDAWIDGGAKASTEKCANGSVPSGEIKPLSCKADLVIKPGQPYAIKKGADQLDQYVCYGYEATVAKKRHVIGMGPKIDNKKVIHHILLFQSNKAESTTPFACESTGDALNWQLVGGWAPGGGAYELPPEVGFPEEAGTTHWVMQIHYNNSQGLEGATDSTGYELCTTDQLRPNDAGMMALGSTKFEIPPRSEHKIKCDYTLPSTFQGRTIFGMAPHMHGRGMAMSTERVTGSATETVLDQKSFSWENQSVFPVSKKINGNDVLRTHCTWKNTSSDTVTYGERTEDEMCFMFAAYYPKVTSTGGLFPLPFVFGMPAAFANCTTE